MERSFTARLLVSFSVLAAIAGTFGVVQPVTRLPYPRGLTAWIDLWPLTHPGPQLAMQVMLAVLMVLLWRGRRPTPVVLAILVLGTVQQLLSSAMHTDWGERQQGSQMPIAALVAWLVGRTLLRQNPSRSATLPEDLACGVFAAGYTLAGVAKLSASGFAWVDGRALALLIQERAPTGGPVLEPIRSWVAQQSTLCTGMMAGALVLELAGPVFLFPAARMPFALCAVLMHASIGTLMGYPHADWAFGVVGWALASRASHAAASKLPEAPAA